MENENCYCNACCGEMEMNHGVLTSCGHLFCGKCVLEMEKLDKKSILCCICKESTSTIPYSLQVPGHVKEYLWSNPNDSMNEAMDVMLYQRNQAKLLIPKMAQVVSNLRMELATLKNKCHDQGKQIKELNKLVASNQRGESKAYRYETPRRKKETKNEMTTPFMTYQFNQRKNDPKGKWFTPRNRTSPNGARTPLKRNLPEEYPPTHRLKNIDNLRLPLEKKSIPDDHYANIVSETPKKRPTYGSLKKKSKIWPSCPEDDDLDNDDFIAQTDMLLQQHNIPNGNYQQHGGPYSRRSNR